MYKANIGIVLFEHCLFVQASKELQIFALSLLARPNPFPTHMESVNYR
jgi:hypothetical protein